MADLILPRERSGTGTDPYLRSRSAEALEVAAARAQLPRETEAGFLELHRSRRHGAGPEGHAAGPRRSVRAGRQGVVPVVGADERAFRPRSPACTEVVMVVPTPRGEINELVLAAACIAGVDRVFTIGGAQAVAALGLWHRKRAEGRQGGRPGQHLCRHRQAPRVWPGRHRHDRRPVRDPRGVRRPDRSGLDRHGPVLPGRARRRRPGDSGQPRRRVPRQGRRQHRQTDADHGTRA